MHQISVIISNFNGAKYLPRLFESLRAQQGVELEIIVVDRNSVDDSDSILSQNPDIKVIKHPPETGLVSGYAMGADIAKHELLMFCNEDMWYEPLCFERLAAAIDLQGRIGAVMPVQWTYDMASIVTCGAWFAKALWCRSNPYPFRITRWHLPEQTTMTSSVNAGACMVSRRVYDEVGGWDRTFFLDYEDTDLCIRLWQHGWFCLVVPEAKVGHAVGASNGQAINGGRQKVSRKRYIEGSSNVIAIAIKTFTGISVVLPFLSLAWRLCLNLARLRLQLACWDTLVFADVLKRLPELAEYRSRNRQLNEARPGQAFYVDPSFDYSTMAGNHARHCPHEITPALHSS